MKDESLSSGEIAAYLDGQLDGEEIASVEARLADDPVARQEIIKASRIVSSVPRRERARRRWVPAAASLLAIAALMLIAVRPQSDAPRSVGRSERRGALAEPDRIDLIAPVEGQRIASREISFAWRPVDGATYRVVLSDAAGRTLLQRNTSDTLMTVQESIFRGAIGSYYWSVDALAPDGTSVTSGVRELVIPDR